MTLDTENITSLQQKEIVVQPTSLDQFTSEIADVPDELLDQARQELKTMGEPSWVAFSQNPGTVAREVAGFSKLLENPEKNPILNDLFEDLETLKQSEFEQLVTQMVKSMLAISQARLEMAFGMEGKLPGAAVNWTQEQIDAFDQDSREKLGKIGSEMRHYDEVIRLTAEIMEPERTSSRVDYFLALMAAAGHDIDKFAMQPDDKGNLRQFDLKSRPDNDRSLYHHEVISAHNVALFNQLNLLKNIASKPEHNIRVSDQLFQTIAAIQAGHGKYEYPYNNAKAKGLEYYEMPLMENNLPSIVVHLADYITGMFGEGRKDSNNKIFYGSSFSKYSFVHFNFMNFSLQQSLESSLQTTQSGVNEANRLLAAMEQTKTGSGEIKDNIDRVTRRYAENAHKFGQWVSELGPTDSLMQVFNNPDSTPLQKQSGMTKLLKVFSQEMQQVPASS